MRRFFWLIAIAAIAGAVALNPRVFLAPLGAYLVAADEPVKSDCLFVLAGDHNGQRIMRAVELYRQGLAQKIFISGPWGNYGHSEDGLAIDFARRKGAKDVPFIGLPIAASSTLTEGQAVLPHLRKHGCRSVLVVTSDFHTRRAGRILRRVWPGLEVRIAAAPSVDFDAGTWWTDRTYKKTFFFEWSKTIAEWLGT